MKLLPNSPTRSGANDTLGSGAELAGLVVVFFLLGWGLDVLCDTRPVFMIAFVVFAVVGQFVKMYFVYNHRMQSLEAERTLTARGRQR